MQTWVGSKSGMTHVMGGVGIKYLYSYFFSLANRLKRSKEMLTWNLHALATGQLKISFKSWFFFRLYSLQ